MYSERKSIVRVVVDEKNKPKPEKYLNKYTHFII